MEHGHMHTITPEIAAEIRAARVAMYPDPTVFCESAHEIIQKPVTLDWLARVESGAPCRINSQRARVLVRLLVRDFWAAPAPAPEPGFWRSVFWRLLRRKRPVEPEPLESDQP